MSALNRHIHLDLPGPRSTTVHWPESHSRNHKPTEKEYKSSRPGAKPLSTMPGGRLVFRISVLPSWVESPVYTSSSRIPQINPHKRPMHSVPLWIGCRSLFQTLFCWQSHVTALDQALRFPSYRPLQLDPSLISFAESRQLISQENLWRSWRLQYRLLY